MRVAHGADVSSLSLTSGGVWNDSAQNFTTKPTASSGAVFDQSDLPSDATSSGTYDYIRFRRIHREGESAVPGNAWFRLGKLDDDSAGMSGSVAAATTAALGTVYLANALSDARSSAVPTAAQVAAGLAGKAAASHTHIISAIDGLQNELNAREMTAANLASVLSAAKPSGVGAIVASWLPIATDAEAQAGDDAVKLLSPAGLLAAVENAGAVRTAISAIAGGAALLSGAAAPAANIGADGDYYLRTGAFVALYLKISGAWVSQITGATTAQRGLVELATAAETRAGTDTARAITASGMLSAINTAGPIKSAIEALASADTDTYFIDAFAEVPEGTDITGGISLTSGGVWDDGADKFTTKPTTAFSGAVVYDASDLPSDAALSTTKDYYRFVRRYRKGESSVGGTAWSFLGRWDQQTAGNTGGTADGNTPFLQAQWDGRADATDADRYSNPATKKLFSSTLDYDSGSMRLELDPAANFGAADLIWQEPEAAPINFGKMRFRFRVASTSATSLCYVALNSDLSDGGLSFPTALAIQITDTGINQHTGAATVAIPTLAAKPASGLLTDSEWEIGIDGKLLIIFRNGVRIVDTILTDAQATLLSPAPDETTTAFASKTATRTGTRIFTTCLSRR